MSDNAFNIKTADFVFEIIPLHPGIKRFFRDYLTCEEAEYRISPSEEDIEYEREQAIKAAKIEGRDCGSFPDSYLECTAVSRHVSEYISFHSAALFHGALIERQGKGYLFAAKSGTGKTTHIMNWAKKFDDVIVVNGDKPFLRAEEDGVYGYGTPWCGKENLNTNKKVKLECLIILERDVTNHIEPVRYTDYIKQLFTQLYIPHDENGLARTLRMIRELSEKVRLYRLGCNMELESATVAYEGMRM